MIKKNRIFCGFILFFTVTCFGQEQEYDCPVVKDTLYLITLDVRSSTDFPLIMHGVSKNSKVISQLKTKNVDLLLESFYYKTCYVPDLEAGPRKIVWACFKDSAYDFLKSNELRFAYELGDIRENSTEEKFRLASGETVYVQKCIIGGIFWKVDKQHPGINKSLNEKDINTIKNIKNCYVQLELNYFQKGDIQLYSPKIKS